MWNIKTNSIAINFCHFAIFGMFSLELPNFPVLFMNKYVLHHFTFGTSPKFDILKASRLWFIFKDLQRKSMKGFIDSNFKIQVHTCVF